MSSPPKPPLLKSSSSSSSSSPSKQSTSSVHQKLSSVLGTSSSSGSKPFIKSKSQTSSSIVFPSFRFSPESEEIQEVLLGGGDGNGGEEEKGAGGEVDQGETPSTSKSGGDISPLKEYILKHKWANKWDKRSLSLDLDLKGKLFTALEDKRKSFVSQFLNEEDEEISMGEPMTPLTTSCSIPEQLVVGSGSVEDCEESLSVHSDTVLFRHGSDRASRRGDNTKFNFLEENCPDYFDYEDEYDVVDELPIGSAGSIPLQLDPSDLRNLVVEEIGVDCCEDIMGVGKVLDGGDGSSRSSLLREFVLPPDSLQERFEGLPTLYNPPSVVMGLRKYPIQEGGGGGGNVGQQAEQEELREDDALYRKAASRTDYSVSGLVRNIVLDIVYHPWVKYWVGLLAAVLILDLGSVIGKLIWFLLGVGGTVICSRALWKGEWEEDGGGGEEESTAVSQSASTFGSAITLSTAVSVGSEGGEGGDAGGMMLVTQQRRQGSAVGNGLKWKSQGWLLILNATEPSPYPVYNPLRNHLRDTKAVFARLNGPYLTLSIPHSRHRIPKRRLWSDPVINSEHIFIRHQQYDLTNAKVEIVPEGLAKKRAWCKKYPIGITIASEDKFCGELSSVVGGRESPVSDGEDGKVSFSKDEKGNEKVKVGTGSIVEKPKGEVFKEAGSCSGKVIYLFARCDREKDDWFRRLVAATRIHPPTTPRTSITSPDSTPSKSPSPSPDFGHFFTFMQRACPTLMIAPSLFAPISPRVTPTNDLLYESVSMHHISAQQQDQQSSQASSRKSSPDKLESFNFIPGEVVINPSFLNAMIGRLFYDFLQSERWNEKVKKLIDRKLFFIRKPAMVQSLKVKSLEFGDSLPMINHASNPVLDSQGLWVDLDIGFVGNIVITLEAFINLMKMGASWDEARVQADLNRGERNRPNNNGGGGRGGSLQNSPSKHAMFDSEADDSGESSESSDDEVDPEVEGEGSRAGSISSTNKQPEHNLLNKSSGSNTTLNTSGGRGKLLKYADSFAKSSVMRNKHVQKVVTGIATTPLILTVEIRRVVGSVAVNIPPVPNDRAWIGFRSNPIIEINVRPKVGQRVVSLSQVTEWIKKKILLEFQRVMVCPNMMDITIPLMEFQLPK